MEVMVFPENSQDSVKLAQIRGEGLDQLRNLQHIVGGRLEDIHTTRLDIQGNVALVDEDGRNKGRKANYRATSAIGYPTVIYGTVVLCGLSDDKTEWIDYKEAQHDKAQ